MNQDKLISISQASKLLGVNIMTLRRWTNSGKIKCCKTIGNHRKYLLSEILSLQGKEVENENLNEDVVAIYTRVSSNDQKQHGDLDRQKTRVMEYCISKGYKVGYILDDCCSGMKYNRPKLDKLYQLVIGNEMKICVQ